MWARVTQKTTEQFLQKQIELFEAANLQELKGEDAEAAQFIKLSWQKEKLMLNRWYDKQDKRSFDYSSYIKELAANKDLNPNALVTKAVCYAYFLKKTAGKDPGQFIKSVATALYEVAGDSWANEYGSWAAAYKKSLSTDSTLAEAKQEVAEAKQERVENAVAAGGLVAVGIFAAAAYKFLQSLTQSKTPENAQDKSGHRPASPRS